MKITGNGQIDLNNKLDLTNLDYEFNINHKSIGLTTKKKNKKIQNGLDIESNLGPLNLKVNLYSEKTEIPTDLKNINLNLLADYELNKNLKLGIKYEADCEQQKYEILSGCIKSNYKHNDVDLNLSTENIIYGYKNVDNTKINLFGNKINPSIGLIENQVNIGYIYDQQEEIDEYGNKNEKLSNKVSLDLNLDFK